MLSATLSPILLQHNRFRLHCIYCCYSKYTQLKLITSIETRANVHRTTTWSDAVCEKCTTCQLMCVTYHTGYRLISERTISVDPNTKTWWSNWLVIFLNIANFLWFASNFLWFVSNRCRASSMQSKLMNFDWAPSFSAWHSRLVRLIALNLCRYKNQFASSGVLDCTDDFRVCRCAASNM